MAGFHIGVRGKAAGQIVRCDAREGACKLTGADGEPTPHFASLADGEAFLAQQENAEKGGFTPAANSNTDATGGDTGASDENTDSTDNTVDYDDTAADALQSHNDALEHFERVTGKLETLNSNRDWFSQYIVSPSGDIPSPHLFPTTADKIKLLQQADTYYTAANEAEESLRTIARSLQSTIGRNAALALTAEVHRLTHQEGEVGDLLRDLDSKGLLKVMVIPKPNKGEHTISFSPDWETEDDDEKRTLLEQASENLRATMGAYPQDTLKAMTTYAFKDQTDESVWPWTSFYLLYTNKFRTIQDAKIYRNMQSFASIMLAGFDDSISEYKKTESDLYTFVENAAKAYNKTQERSQE